MKYQINSVTWLTDPQLQCSNQSLTIRLFLSDYFTYQILIEINSIQLLNLTQINFTFMWSASFNLITFDWIARVNCQLLLNAISEFHDKRKCKMNNKIIINDQWFQRGRISFALPADWWAYRRQSHLFTDDFHIQVTTLLLLFIHISTINWSIIDWISWVYTRLTATISLLSQFIIIIHFFKCYFICFSLW